MRAGEDDPRRQAGGEDLWVSTRTVLEIQRPSTFRVPELRCGLGLA